MVALMDSADERFALMAADKVFERAWGKARECNPAKDDEEPLRDLKLQAELRAERLTPRGLDAIEEFASARLAAIEAREACAAGGEGDS
jgi:hypothetical protein